MTDPLSVNGTFDQEINALEAAVLSAAGHRRETRQGVDGETICLFQDLILSYYRRFGRNLPWRNTLDPYHILVSEYMLQQTQVERVIPAYTAFLETFPTLHDLQSAPLSHVLAAWSGLGYNRRAVNLKKAAGVLVEGYDGSVPADPGILATLPGIGNATAGAICAYAFNMPVVYIETNIRRIFIYYFFQEGLSEENEMKTGTMSNPMTGTMSDTMTGTMTGTIVGKSSDERRDKRTDKRTDTLTERRSENRADRRRDERRDKRTDRKSDERSQESRYDPMNIPDTEILPLISATLYTENPRDWYSGLMDYGTILKKRIRSSSSRSHSPVQSDPGYGLLPGAGPGSGFGPPSHARSHPHSNAISNAISDPTSNPTSNPIVDPNQRSRHYTRQPPFAGSDRQIRGRIIRLLIEKNTLSKQSLIESIPANGGRIEKILADLRKEGFLCEEAGVYSIRE